MNRFTAWITAVSAAVVLAVGVTGCGVSTSDSAPPRQAETRTAPCNLGAEWDAAALVTRATYIEPSLTEELRQRYVGMIADNSCGDAEVLNWQDLRRALGESDGICRIAWYDDPVTDSTYDIGCVVPVEVIPGAVL